MAVADDFEQVLLARVGPSARKFDDWRRIIGALGPGPFVPNTKLFAPAEVLAATSRARGIGAWPVELVVIGEREGEDGGVVCLDARYRRAPVVIVRGDVPEEHEESLFTMVTMDT